MLRFQIRNGSYVKAAVQIADQILIISSALEKSGRPGCAGDSPPKDRSRHFVYAPLCTISGELA